MSLVDVNNSFGDVKFSALLSKIIHMVTSRLKGYNLHVLYQKLELDGQCACELIFLISMAVYVIEW